ncbi:hypothetical protein F5X99DRAFT_158860 [Biscogniauxia marginata]|nr:hypothetical protein F5X99DRAFT_158860 [Biscogniauxia marginata]
MDISSSSQLPRFTCNRCAWEFPNSRELALHQRSTRPCELRQPDCLEGISSEQESQLKSRKKEFTSKPEDEKWVDVYCVLFPNDDILDIPTPYYEYSNERNKTPGRRHPQNGPTEDMVDLSAYQAYLEAELPHSLQRELERELEIELDISDDDAKNHAIKLIREFQPKLLRNFLQTQPQVPTKRNSASPGILDEDKSCGNNIRTTLSGNDAGGPECWSTMLDFLDNSCDSWPWNPLDENLMAEPQIHRKPLKQINTPTDKDGDIWNGKLSTSFSNPSDLDTSFIVSSSLDTRSSPITTVPIHPRQSWENDAALGYVRCGVGSSSGFDVVFS